MTIYNIEFYNDMGHLVTKPEYDKIPKHIRDFAYSKAKMYLNIATDNSNLGCAFYILKNGLNKSWTYYTYNDVVNIVFNNCTMKYI